jgi:hypothetical protein
MGTNFKPDENQRFRDNRKSLEEVIKKIDSSSSKDPANKSILEELNNEQRIFFQNEMNKKIIEIKDQFLKDYKDPSKQKTLKELEGLKKKTEILEKLPNIIFNSKDKADEIMSTFDQSHKDYLDDIYNKAKNFQKNQDSISATDNTQSRTSIDNQADSVSFDNKTDQENKSPDYIKYGENNLSTQIQDMHEKFIETSTLKKELEDKIKEIRGY